MTRGAAPLEFLELPAQYRSDSAWVALHVAAALLGSAAAADSDAKSEARFAFEDAPNYNVQLLTGALRTVPANSRLVVMTKKKSIRMLES